MEQPRLVDYVAAGTPALYMKTNEPGRAMQTILTCKALVNRMIVIWDRVNGITFLQGDNEDKIEPVKIMDPVEALQWLTKYEVPKHKDKAKQVTGIVMAAMNLHYGIKSPEVIQVIHNDIHTWEKKGKTLIVVSAILELPLELAPMFTVIEHALPTERELSKILGSLVKSDQPADEISETVQNALGMTGLEAKNAFSLSMSMLGKYDRTVVSTMKSQLVMKNACLHLSNFTERFEDLVGLQRIKDYLKLAVKSPLFRGLLLLGVPGTGKCLAKGTLVLMHDGTRKKVEDIEVGEFLMGPDSKPRKVLNLSHGFGPLFKVAPTKGEPYVVNENHILSLKTCRKGRHDLVNMPIKEYISWKGAWKPRTKGWRTGVDWPSQKTNVDLPPHLLGVWIGDGDAGLPRITTMEPEVADEMKDYCDNHGLRLVKYDEKSKAAHYGMSGRLGGLKDRTNPFTAALEEYGICREKRLPKEYMINSEEVRLELLAGVLDADALGQYILSDREIR
jgi:hypothetical protein